MKFKKIYEIGDEVEYTGNNVPYRGIIHTINDNGCYMQMTPTKHVHEEYAHNKTRYWYPSGPWRLIKKAGNMLENYTVLAKNGKQISSTIKKI